MKKIAEAYTYNKEHCMFVLPYIMRIVFVWEQGRILQDYAYCLN